MAGTQTLEAFFDEIRSSCGEHAERKGYLQDGRNVLGEMMSGAGIEGPHAAGEVFTKALEYTRAPRRLLAVKIAGWAWRMWLAADKD
ncbi:MAG TPA: hypothetical protein VGF88_23705 [Acidobacteriaceae bacterium]